MTSEPKSENSKATSTKIEEADILKFQLLSAYVGMRTQDVEALEKDLELLETKKILAEIARKDALDEVTKYHNWLREGYHLQPSDLVNYADGIIQRNNQPTNENENQKTKNPTGQQTQEKEEAEKPQTDEESVRSP